MNTVACLMCLAFAAMTVASASASESFDSGWHELGGAWQRHGSAGHVEAGDGAKLVRDALPDADFEVSLRVRVASGQAGILFHAFNPGPGHDDVDGFYFGLDPAENQVLFGKLSHGDPFWTPMVHRNFHVAANTWYNVRLVAHESRFQGFVHRSDFHPASPEWPLFDVEDTSFPNGSLGLRAFGGTADFEDFKVSNPALLPSGPTYSNEGGLMPDIADPYVLRADNKYYIYGTGGNGLRVYTSTDLVHWSGAEGATNGFALVPQNSWGTRWFWAPEVYPMDGGYRMWYAAEERMCHAESKSPLGPFVQNPKRPRASDTYEIDMHVFKDDDGKSYLYWVHGDHGNVVFAAELEADGVTVKEDTIRKCVEKSQKWEYETVNEGPFVQKHKGVYYLTYSGNGYLSPDYGVAYATATNPLGPWTKYAYNPILQSNAYVHGAGHHSITESPDGKELFIVYHTHLDLHRANPRKLAIDRLRFAPNPDGGPDILEAYGPTLTPQPMPSGSGKHRPKSDPPSGAAP